MHVTVADHAEKFPRDFEIVGMKDALRDGEAGTRFVRQTVTAAGNDCGDQTGKRTENRNGKDVAFGDFQGAVAAHGAGVAVESAPGVHAADAAARGLIFEVEIGQAWEIDAIQRDVRLIMWIASD